MIWRTALILAGMVFLVLAGWTYMLADRSIRRARGLRQMALLHMPTLMRCPGKHAMSDATCIRRRGHSGNCWTAWWRDPNRPAFLRRTEWASPASSLPGDHRAYRERYLGKEGE